MKFRYLHSLLATLAIAASGLAMAANESVERGRYLAQLGDCVACHTSEKGTAMAGGRALDTPFGKLYSTNITPDKATGIGNYTFEQFDRAMRKGVAADGHNLYPAMPYPSYAKMTADDMQALYTYLMLGLPPVQLANKPSEMHWPFNMRWGLAIWNWFFLDDKPFVATSSKDATWNRGAYLVQGLGHCGACHTPRGFLFQEKTMSDSGSNGSLFLSGETVESWRALSLRDLWTVQDTKLFLKTGQNRYATASGNMADVIMHSTQHVSDDDLLAIASYLKSLPAGPNDKPMPASTEKLAVVAHVPDNLFSTRGGLGYIQFCGDCHRADGGGVEKIFPPLAGNPTVSSKDASTLVHIMLTGGQTAATATHPRVFAMPAFARLADTEMAEILSFVRASWGNGAPVVDAGNVAKMRAELDPKTTDSSKFETPRLANMLLAKNAPQLVRGMRLHLETKDFLPNNVGDQLNCTSCHLNAGTVADGSPFVGVSAFFPSYGARAGRIITIEERINGCFRRSMNGKPLAKDSDDMKAMVAYFDWMKAGRQSRRVWRRQDRPLDEAGYRQRQEDLRRPMCGLPRRKRRGTEERRRQDGLSTVVG